MPMLCYKVHVYCIQMEVTVPLAKKDKQIQVFIQKPKGKSKGANKIMYMHCILLIYAAVLKLSQVLKLASNH